MLLSQLREVRALVIAAFMVAVGCSGLPSTSTCVANSIGGAGSNQNCATGGNSSSAGTGGILGDIDAGSTIPNWEGNGEGVVGPEGGTISLTDGPTIYIPPGALTTNTSIRITASTKSPLNGAITPVYQFHPNGLTFALPATVRFRVPSDTSSAVLLWSAPGDDPSTVLANSPADAGPAEIPSVVYETIPVTLDGGVATGQTLHFSEAWLAYLPTGACALFVPCAIGTLQWFDGILKCMNGAYVNGQGCPPNSDAGVGDAGVGDAGVGDAGIDGGTMPSNPDGSGSYVPTNALSCSDSDSGATLCNEENCCTSVVVPSGTTLSVGWDQPVASYALDKYDVTVGRFRKFVQAWNGSATGTTQWRPLPGSGKHAHLNGGKGLVIYDSNPPVYEPGWQESYNSNLTPAADDVNHSSCAQYRTWTPSPGDNESYPMNCVNWYEAYAFCIWDGGFLPTQTEWEYVARGGDEQRLYPWGAADPGTNSEYAVYGCYYHGTGPGSCTGLQNLSPVGALTAGAGRWGQLDLAGNLLQWTLGSGAAYMNLCAGCVAYDGELRGLMGGRFWYEYLPTGDNYSSATASYYSYDVGLRCARSRGGVTTPTTPHLGTQFVPQAARSCSGSTLDSLSCNGENCCASVDLPGGTYQRSSATVTLSPFALDKYDVTVDRYRKFLQAWQGGSSSPWRPVAGSGKHSHLNGGSGLVVSNAAPTTYEAGWKDSYSAQVNALFGVSPYITMTTEPGTQENLPVNDVNWYEAYAFCIWDGGFLPTEAEWEFAAVGNTPVGTPLPRYPWGSQDAGNANEYAIYNCYFNGWGEGSCTGAINIAPVGAVPGGAGPWGHLDLLGNVAQWTLGSVVPYSTACSDCLYTEDELTPMRELRGAGFDADESLLIATARTSTTASSRLHTRGIRCARPPE